MDTRHFQLAIIGSGPGGYRAAVYAAEHGLQVAVVEEAEVGGTCLNRGCIPTKTLCHEADRLSVIREALPEAQVDFDRVRRRLDSVTSQLRGGVEQLLSKPGITIVRGRAAFVDAATIEVEGHGCLSADNIIVATGSLPKLPPGLRLLRADGTPAADGVAEGIVMSSTELMATDRLPRRLCIVGAGVIGMEMASVFSRFGAEVTVVEFLRECLPAVDGEIAKRLRKQMERQGIAFVMQAAVQEVALMPTGERRVAYLDKKGRECLLQADAVLVATGRQPNTTGLKLETTGVAIGRGGFIVVDDNMQTTVPHLYAIGDVNGRNLLAHAATMQGFRAVRHILRSMDDGRCLAVDGECPVPAAIFTVPECACVGMTEEQAKEQLLSYVCRKSHYRSSGRAVAMEQTEGMVKLLADGSTGRIVGCHVYGAHAADIVQEATALMSLGATVDQLASVVHIHPTLGELLQEAAL